MQRHAYYCYINVIISDDNLRPHLRHAHQHWRLNWNQIALQILLSWNAQQAKGVDGSGKAKGGWIQLTAGHSLSCTWRHICLTLHAKRVQAQMHILKKQNMLCRTGQGHSVKLEKVLYVLGFWRDDKIVNLMTSWMFNTKDKRNFIWNMMGQFCIRCSNESVLSYESCWEYVKSKHTMRLSVKSLTSA